MSIGLPESSVRGFWIACAGFAEERSDEVASALRAVRFIKVVFDVRGLKVDKDLDASRKAAGARKSRYSGSGEATAARMYVLDDW